MIPICQNHLFAKNDFAGDGGGEPGKIGKNIQLKRKNIMKSTIRLIPEYCSTCLWSVDEKSGETKSELEFNTFNLSDDLVRDLVQLSADYNQENIDEIKYAIQGLSIAIRLRKEIPDSFEIEYITEGEKETLCYLIRKETFEPVLQKRKKTWKP